MTERNTKFIEDLNEKLKDQANVLQNWEGRGVDPMLQWLVDLSNQSNSRYLVTLTVGGNLISGVLIPMGEYLDELSEQIASQFSHQKAAEVARKIVLDWKVPEDEVQPTPQLIHLKDADVFSSSGMPIAPASSLWRGKISSVDGFSLGRLVAERND